jgi:DNA-binding MarR family transcriptional regulator
MTRLGLIEGDILNYLEDSPHESLHQLIHELKWEPCVISMAAGSLIRQGLIRTVRVGRDVMLEVITKPVSP